MLELKIDLVNLNIANAAGHEHRVRNITSRAMALLAEGLDERAGAASLMPGVWRVNDLTLRPVNLNLGGMSDEQAASALASALLEALALKLEI